MQLGVEAKMIRRVRVKGRSNALVNQKNLLFCFASVRSHFSSMDEY